MIGRVVTALRTRGIGGVLSGLKSRLVKPRLHSYALVAPLVAGKTGLEIGGPTELFRAGGLLPVYGVAGRVDNCNFTQQTVWEGTIQEGQTFLFDPRRAPGRQYIVEASDLKGVPSDAYDFILSAHTLEHCANPLLTLTEWARTLRTGGALVLILPHKDGTFDHRRPVTTLAHLIDDHAHGTTEADLTHLPEILQLHDLSLDPPAGDYDAFKARSERNVENRCLHHHVFDTHLAVEVVDWLGMTVLAVEPFLLHHILVIARKGDAPKRANARFLDARAPYRLSSPFPTDRGSVV